MDSWRNFIPGRWTEHIDVRDFIQKNYRPYEGDEKFLAGPTERTKRVLARAEELLRQERENGGVYKIDTDHVSSFYDEFEPGYLSREDDLIVGFQTDEPLKRAINPFGGIRMAKAACVAYGYEFPEKIAEDFRYRTTHNDGVFSVYTHDIRVARKAGLLTGLPDGYGRGRIIGDYRRVALYGLDFLRAQKLRDIEDLGRQELTEANIRLLSELNKQVQSFDFLRSMAAKYGFDISRPAADAREAIQWTYFAYLGAIKTQNGAAMSLGRVSTFFDIYLERDIEAGLLTEESAQELIDDFVIKLRLARHLRTPEYNELFAGDPMWITEALGGQGLDGRTLVSRTTFRFLHCLENLNPAPEPNLTVLFAAALPPAFKAYCARLSIETDSIQYENDDLMRPVYGDDYGIACCVSAMKIGRQMQFFGARCNLPKALLLAINGGTDVKTGLKLGPQLPVMEDDVLTYDAVMERFKQYLAYLAHLYVSTMNVIHYSHDLYAYERVEMSLHDTDVERLMAFGIAGLSVAADSFSALKYAKVIPLRDEDGYIVDYRVEGEFPKFGNDDDRVDSIAVSLTEMMIEELRRTPCYRGATHTLSILTITSNVMYGRKTMATPDGRKDGEPFAPGANPMHNREKRGAIASLNSVAKLDYSLCRDGISNTFSITKPTLGSDEASRVANLVSLLDGYFGRGGFHLNVNVMNRATLLDAMDHPERYPNLTIRVSGYAVNFIRLSRAHQEEVISRTFHEKF